MWDGPAFLKPGLSQLQVVGSKPSNEKSKRHLSTVACKPQRKSTQNRFQIDQKSTPNRSQNGPRSAQGAIGGPKDAPERPRVPPEASKAAPEEAQKAPLDPTGAPKERSGGPKERPKIQRASDRGSGIRKIEPEALAKAKKVNFDKSAPRPAPADAPDTSDPPKPRQNQSQIDPSRPLGTLERSPRST